jgi:hypothetical protein
VCLLALVSCAAGPRAGDTGAGAPWLLIVPPERHQSGAIRMDDQAPLWEWRRLAGFLDEVECRRFRDDHIVAARSDEEWAMWSLSRCETAERAEQGALLSGE